MALHIREHFINATEGVNFGETDVQEAFTDDVGQLFRDLQREYGRCVSSMYRDTADGPERIGWVFQSRQRYEGSDDTYLREVWVELFDGPEVTNITPAPTHVLA